MVRRLLKERGDSAENQFKYLRHTCLDKKCGFVLRTIRQCQIFCVNGLVQVYLFRSNPGKRQLPLIAIPAEARRTVKDRERPSGASDRAAGEAP